MSTTVAEIPDDSAPAPQGGVQSTLAQRWAALDGGARLRWLGAAALAALALVLAALFYRTPPYKVLFANLTDKDGGAIVAQLAQMNVPYQYTEGGGAILVPAKHVHDVRLKLATLGLPRATVSGFELTESNPFGITQFQERLNFQRGLEGELTRSIEALAAVQNARVHLALPNQNGFFREQQKPSASVLVRLYPGRMLDGAQIAGIVHLVASSVPEMAASAVNVLDDSGKLLSGADSSAQAVEMQQLAYAREVEQQYVRRIVDILEPVVGAGNVRAQVSAQMDFSVHEETAEQHRPNQTPQAGAVRSQQVLESTGERVPPQPTGVPGAVSNQPPQDASAPINGDNPAPQAADGQNASAAPGGKRESITNYEVDKTVRHTRSGSGAIARLSAAVVVNAAALGQGAGAGEAAEAGQADGAAARQREELLALVRETVGYQAARGDSVQLVSAPFVQEAAPPLLPLWQRPEVLALARKLALPVGGVLAALLALALVRRARRKQRDNAPGSQLSLLEDAPGERPALPAPALELAPTQEHALLEQARALTQQNPVAVAHIVKNWIHGEGGHG